MKIKSLQPWLIAVLCVLLWSCNATKKVPEGRFLLQKNHLKINTDRSQTRKGELKDALLSTIRQKPNKKFLLQRWGLHIYNLNDLHYYTDTGFVAPRNRLSETPVLEDSTMRQQTALAMNNVLINKGYFNAEVHDTVIYKKKKAFVFYKVKTNKNYIIDSVFTDVDDSTIAEIVHNSMPNTKLKKGIEYSYDLILSEQNRISEAVRDKGYYKFNQRNIVNIELDTLNSRIVKEKIGFFEQLLNTITIHKRGEQKTAHAKVIIRHGNDPKAYETYKYNRITVLPTLNDNNIPISEFRIDTLQGIRYAYIKKYITNQAIQDKVFLSPNQLYSQRDYDHTINQLNKIGAFKYVRISLFEDTSKTENLLNALIQLDPIERYDFNTNFELSTGTQFYTQEKIPTFGSNLGFGITNKNWLKRGYRASIQAFGGLEFGYNRFSQQDAPTLFALSRSVGLNTSITFPKFLSPIGRGRFVKRNEPSTTFSLGASLTNRVVYFSMINLNANYSFNWKANNNSQWNFSPLFINVLQLPKITDTFQAILDSNRFMSNSYQETIIEGRSISYTFSNQGQVSDGQNYGYLRASFEEAGSLLALTKAIANNNLGFNFAQYLKLDFDARRYFPGGSDLGVVRFNAGLGIPLGNSETLPFIKQYFAGGPYSMRGWRIRRLGPGSFNDTTAIRDPRNYIDRMGEIKIEGNAEYRFNMLQLYSGIIKLNGAVFGDAGNIWLAKKNDQYPKGEFAFNKFFKDLAISSGAGLRIDIATFLLLRLDMSIPVKHPEYEFDLPSYKLGSKSWWQNVPVYQFAIGYPF